MAFYMKISKKNKKIFSVTAIALIAVIVALLVIPSDVVLERKEFSYTSDTQKGIDFSNSFKEYICVGNNVLCVDEKTGSIAFLNKTTKGRSKPPIYYLFRINITL